MGSESDRQGEFLVFRLPNARRKAMRSAAAEATSLLAHLGAREAANGPFGNQVGLFYVEMPRTSLEAAVELIPRLGYTDAVELVEFANQRGRGKRAESPRWRGRPYTLVPVYQSDRESLRDDAPDRREFILPAEDGGLRRVIGYRGDSRDLHRRGLAVVDARLLVNLVFAENRGRFLDPFAGTGGIIIEAVKSGYETYSADVDPFVMYGLHNLASHAVADARRLPFRDACFNSIASEPPYDEASTQTICQAVGEMDRVLKPGCSAALMVADHQAESVLLSAATASWQLRLREHIDRKGLPVTVLSWQKP
jgi:16S rRNA G966 N2-methylase RsmD